MPQRRRRLLSPAVLVLFLAGFALASCGGDGEGEPPAGTTTEATTTTAPTTAATTATGPQAEAPTVVRIEVVNGAPEGGIVRETVDEGDRVVIVVRSDVADEVHLHGYDISRDVAAGGAARIGFVAKLPGRFEVELEERGVQIADLTVRP